MFVIEPVEGEEWGGKCTFCGRGYQKHSQVGRMEDERMTHWQWLLKGKTRATLLRKIAQSASVNFSANFDVFRVFLR